MKRLSVVAMCLAMLFVFAACEKDEHKLEDNTEKHQPAHPSSWSPSGHVYVYETTWEGSHATDNYWVWVLDFFGKDSVVKYQTPNRDLTYSTAHMYLVDSTKYEMDYPTIIYHSLAGGTSPITIKDTLTLYWKAIDVTYGMIHN